MAMNFIVHSLSHLNKIIGIGWPTLVFLTILFFCDCLADSPQKFNSGTAPIIGGVEHPKNSQQTGIASSIASNWEGSGANPDDEDGDVDEEGSGDGPSEEGSGSPPDEFEQRKPNESVAITDTRFPAQFGDSAGQQQYANATTTTVTDLHSLGPFFAPSTTRAVPTITTTTTIMLATTLRPPLMRPITTASTATALPSSVSKSSPKLASATTTLPKVVKTNHEEKWPQPPKGTSPPFMPPTPTKRPFFIADPSGTLEQLRPGIFAFMVGGVVVGLLLLILIISYLVYRLKKRDEGTYICEEPHQQTHYPYAYQKASIREFYA